MLFTSGILCPAVQNRIQGFGSTNYSGGSGGSAPGGGGSGGGGDGVGGMLGSGLALGQSALNRAAGAVSNASSAVSRGMQVRAQPPALLTHSKYRHEETPAVHL